MVLAYWFILIAGLMPYGLVKIARGSHFDNHNPRDAYNAPVGRQKRAYNAHVNSFEAFPLYAAAVLIALQAGMDGWLLNMLAGSWLLLRVGYIYAYLNDMATWRSRIWAMATLVAILILTMPLWAPYPDISY